MEYAISTFNLTKKFVKMPPPPKTLGGRLRKFFRVGSKREELTAVDHVNLNIERGELFGLLGPNGAGKTTLIKMLCTLVYPTEGTARLNGYDIVKDSFMVRKSITAVLDPFRGFWWRLSARRNLLFYATLYDVPKSIAEERVESYLKMFELSDKMHEMYQKLSDGERRKLAVARAMIPDAPILLLDEPTLGLDPSSAKYVRSLIRDKICGQENRTILLTTHIMEEADQMCDRIAVINEGKIVTVDTPANVKKSVKSEDVLEIRVANCKPSLVQRIRELELVNRAVDNLIDEAQSLVNLRIHTKDADTLTPILVKNIVKHGGKVISLKREEPTLEDAFIKLTRRGL